MSQPIPPSYTVMGENAETGATVIKAELKAGEVDGVVARMKQEGLRNVKVAAVKDAAGSAG